MDENLEGLTAAIEAELVKQFGPVLSGDKLYQSLGYPTMGALRQALVRRTVPVTVFTVPGRNGKYALSRDIAAWLAAQRLAADRAKPRPHNIRESET
ncbi:MAG: hypothetical protein CL583_10515 [Alteromonadaceae bacterium]|nr:hypothetical protein [Alteromonadaceae bacterium]|tara:strand:- start:1469 stop:1759 length:291 start_codon:yes stop_codon:yes gene_type:complete